MRLKREERRKKMAAEAAREAELSRRSAAEKMARALELPPAMLSGVAHVELSGNREALVEGCKGVLEYDDTVIKLSTGRLILKFTGRDMTIRTLNDEQAVIEGVFLSLEYLT